MSQLAKRLLVAAMAFAPSCSAAEPTAHPFHVSMAEVEYNSKSKALEVALKMYAVDAEQALRAIKDKKASFDFDNEAHRDTLLKQYLPANFSIKSRVRGSQRKAAGVDPVTGQLLAQHHTRRKHATRPFRYVGSEIDGAWVWAYFELPVDISRGQFELSNTVLNEIQLEQLNVVAFKPPRSRDRIIYFNLKKPVQTVHLTEKATQAARE